MCECVLLNTCRLRHYSESRTFAHSLKLSLHCQVYWSSDFFFRISALDSHTLLLLLLLLTALCLWLKRMLAIKPAGCKRPTRLWALQPFFSPSTSCILSFSMFLSSGQLLPRVSTLTASCYCAMVKATPHKQTDSDGQPKKSNISIYNIFLVCSSQWILGYEWEISNGCKILRDDLLILRAAARFVDRAIRTIAGYYLKWQVQKFSVL